MTISSLHTSQPGAVGKQAELYAADQQRVSSGSAPVRESLQEMTDQARLSALAPRIQAMLSEISGPEGSVLGTLTENIDKLQEGFIDTLYTALSSENIDLNEKMTLRLDATNALVVAGEHSQKDRVNGLLSGNPALSTAFGEIASQSEVLRDIANLNKVMTRQTGVAAYAADGASPSSAVYQMSLKGDMSHFYFSRG